MIFYSFANRAFNKDCEEVEIYMVTASKISYGSPQEFCKQAVAFIDDRLFPNEYHAREHRDICLKDGDYENIVKHWISLMSQSIDIYFDEIQSIRRIKSETSNPTQDEFLIETKEEYVLFRWLITA